MTIRFYVTIFVIIATYFINHLIYKKYKNKMASFIPLAMIALETMLIGKWDLTAAICTMVICISINYFIFVCCTESFLKAIIVFVVIAVAWICMTICVETSQEIATINETYKDRYTLRAEDRYITLDIDKNGVLYYLYLVETEEGISLKKSKADETSIIEDNTVEAYIETEYADKIVQNNHLGGIQYTVKNKFNSYVIHLPNGTMK